MTFKKLAAPVLALACLFNASGAFAGMADIGKTARLPAPAKVLMLGNQVDPMQGYADWCTANPTDCAEDARLRDWHVIPMTPENFALMTAVNDGVNARLIPINDKPHYGEDEVWTLPLDGKGDCEDYAMEKKRLMIEAGFDPSSLFIMALNGNARDPGGHAVLGIWTTQGVYIMDMYKKIYAVEKLDRPINRIQSPVRRDLWYRAGILGMDRKILAGLGSRDSFTTGQRSAPVRAAYFVN